MKPNVKIKDVSVTFKKKIALENISFELFSGEVMGLVGPNGAGKTTLMKALLGFIHPTSGSIQSNQKTMTGLIEQPGLYPFMTGLEHLKMYSQEDSLNEINCLIRLLDLSEFINKKVKEYSLGMKQRLGIAMALLNHAEVVILDEPMNGLDPYSVKLLKKTVMTYRDSGTTFLVSSHILSELEQLVDRVLLVKEGRIVELIEHPQQLTNFEDDLIKKLEIGRS
ncbi:ABC-2 type transport system ATP-binding protein [Enterococcus sp. AZ194]|uniref:ABC transporter ATP-binding protein n=1 Tax=Enterococcus sp. AZ194 TaxID=2774629 RepID=UPI003F2574E6